MTTEDQQDARKKVLDKIRKLLAMAYDDRGNDQERENALRQANNLMAKFNIDEAEATLSSIRNNELNLQEGFSKPDGDIPLTGKPYTRCPDWSSVLAYGVAKFTDARSVIKYRAHNGSGCLIAFQGEVGDVEFAVWLFQVLAKSILRAQRKSGLSTRAELDAFRYGAAAVLQQRLVEMVASRKAQYEASSGTALVVVTEKARLIAEKFGDVGKSQLADKDRPGWATAMGMQAGAKMNIPGNRPIEAEPQAKRVAQ